MPELTLNISPPPPPTLVLDISPPQGPEGPQGNTGPQGPEGPQGETGPQPDLSTNTPGSLGVAAAGVSMEASRSDHVHAMPSAADVGALPVELIGLTPEQTERGAWDENETYTLGDVVFFGGFWVGVAPVVGSQPGDVSGEWDMFITSTHIGVGTDVEGIGDYSTAVGVFSQASGEVSTALGIGAQASGEGSTALGYLVEASGNHSVTLGVANQASGDSSTALGSQAKASGEYSVALGHRAEASGEGSTALGYHAEASGEGDVNLANIITGHIDTSTQAADALTLPTGFADLPHTDASSNPNVDSSRLIARSDGLAVRDNTGTEIKLIIDTDSRLTDARTPLAHTHGQSDVTGLVADMAAKQPLDSDLTAIAALSTTAFGRSLLEVVDAVGGRAALSAAAATHAHDGADITSGIVAPARLGSGVADASKVLRGDGSWGAPPAAAGIAFTDEEWSYLSRSSAAMPGSSPYAPGANTVAAVRVEVIETCDISGRWYRPQGGGASDKQRVGLYAADPVTGLPTGLPIVATPESGSESVYVTDTFSAVRVAAGFYWCVGHAQTAMSGWRGCGIAGEEQSLPTDMGGVTISTPGVRCLTAPITYGAADADLTGLTWTARANGWAAPFARWRVERV